MLFIDCPWCAGPATIDVDAGGHDAFHCEACAVRVDLAASPAEDLLAVAA